METSFEIKRRRHELRMSRARAAQLAGISERTLMRIENDEALVTNCRETTLVALAEVLQWPVTRLIRTNEAQNHFVAETSLNGEVLAEGDRTTFGTALQTRREQRGITIEQLSRQAAIPTVDLVAVELGQGRLKPEEFERVKRQFPEDQELRDLWLSSRTIVYDFTRLGAIDRFDVALSDLTELEERCLEMFWNCPQAVPGFAQTPAYTEQWLRRTTNMSPAGVRASLDINAKRVHSFIFRHPSTRLLFHFGFQFSIVDKRVMQEQIKHLATLATLEGVEIKVLKPHSAPSRALFGSWGVIDKALLHAHNLNGAQTNASPHIAGFFISQFEEVWEETSMFMPVEELLPL